MRKRTCMGIMLVIAVVAAAGCLYHMRRDNVLLRVENGQPCISVRTAQSENRVSLWQDEEESAGYFFLPSCVSHHKIRLGDTGESSVRIDGRLYRKGDTFTWEEGQRLSLQITDDSYESHAYEVGFMKSANIPAMFIDTASGSMDYLHEDKENEEPGKICVIQEDGDTEY